MRTVAGLAFLAASLLLALPAAPAAAAPVLPDGGKDELAEGDWEGEETWASNPSGAGSAPASGGAPTTPGGGGGGTPTPPPETGGDSSTAGGGGSGDPEADPGGAEEPGLDPAGGGGGGAAPAPDGSTAPAPAPAPLPSCTSRFVLEQERPSPELYEKETLLTLTLFRTDAYAFVANGYCRSESTWYVDWFTTTSAGRADHRDYVLVVRLEGACPNCAPEFDLDGASYLEARARARTSWGGLSAGSSARAAASTVWSGDLSASDACGASVSNLLTGGEAKLEIAGISISGKETRSEAGETVTGGKGDQNTKSQDSIRVAITNKGSVATYAADVENNCQAKARAGQRLKVRGRAKCGAVGEFDLAVVAK